MNSIQRFLFEQAPIRGEMVHLKEPYLAIIKQRPYPPMIKKLLGEAMVSCLLLVGSIKFEGQLSLQFQGDERFSLLLVQCDHHLNIRAYAIYNDDLSDDDYRQAFEEGKMVITINQYNHTEAYQSIVPITSASMSQNLINYFAQSEQITTCVFLACDENTVAGMLLQLLPGQKSQQREEFWEYATIIGHTITEQELLYLDNEDLLRRLYHEAEIRLFEPKPVQFKCNCNIDKMKQVLKVLGEDDIKKLLSKQDKIEVTCDFCNHHYAFDSIDLALLFRS